MKPERPIEVVFFRTDAGNEPAREWLKSLTKEDTKNIGEDIRTVQYTWPIGKPLVDYLGEQIWEVRSKLKNRIAHVLFIIHENEIVILHGFIKKDQRTPKSELDLARKRKSQYIKRHE
jgi:phage-related protein